MKKIVALNKISNNIRKIIINMHAASNSSHLGSALSCVEILTALYFKILNIDPSSPQDSNRDRFIMSKGHAASALYATLAKRGFFPLSLLNEYGVDGGRLPCHVSKGCAPGVEVSTGSLGHGLSIGAGICLAAKHDMKNHRTFVLLSDGECDEGSVWEAALFAKQHKLDNLIAIIDYNKIQAFGKTKDVLDLEPFAEKWKSFGWRVKELNGHNIQNILNSLEKVPFIKGIPSVIIAHTVKGKGISFMENNLLWHYRSPNEQELKAAIKELANR